MESIIYNIPVALIDAFQGQRVIARSHHLDDLLEKWPEKGPRELCSVQILHLDEEPDRLMRWGYGIPVDLVVQDPCKELASLYRYARLPEAHPVRVTVPMAPGFSRMVKLAASLDFAVKIEGGQPGGEVVDEMLDIARLFLHQASFGVPIEFYYSVFVALYRGDSVSLWTIQEEDPSQMRYVTDRGEETISVRFAGLEFDHELLSFPDSFKSQIIAERGECFDCEFLDICFGYFKRPVSEYRCEGVKTILQTLADSAEQLRKDLASFSTRADAGAP